MPPGAPVPCPGCGRGYAAARFAGGETLHCRCGTRVGRVARVSLPPGPPRFLADAMLGGLARWLRALGYDTAYEAEIADGVLVRRALEEGRILLTRDRRLPEEWRIEPVLLLRSEDPEEQLREVAEAFDLRDGKCFSLCLRCNMPLRPLPPGEAPDGVPSSVRQRGLSLTHCPACERTYWEGSHTARMRETLDRLLGPAQEGEPTDRD